MKMIKDREQIREWVEREHILDYFDTPDLEFQACRYEKGEFITWFDRRLDDMLFLIEGTIQIYGIRENGSISPITEAESPAIIGDIEYIDHGISPFFVETKSPAVCIALSVKKYRKQLDCDLRFLHMLLESYAIKIKTFSMIDMSTSTLEERLLLYMQHIWPLGELDGVESALLQLRCSRRQLQRVLKKLCQEGRVIKIGKGKYRLIEE